LASVAVIGIGVTTMVCLLVFSRVLALREMRQAKTEAALGEAASISY
jgi:hypothetical protein